MNEKFYIGNTRLSENLTCEKKEDRSGILLLLYLAVMFGAAFGYAYKCLQIAGV